MAPSLIPSFEIAVVVFLFFTVVVPGVGVAVLLRVSPDILGRAYDLLPSVHVVKWAVVVGAALCVVALTVQRLRPLPMDASFDEFSRSLPAEDQLPKPNLIGRLQILNVKLSIFSNDGLQMLGPLIEQRLGPLNWTSHTTDPDTRYVTATGGFPATVWRPLFDARALKFQKCVEALRGDKKDAGYIQDWTDWWYGRLTTEEVNRKWGSNVDVLDLLRKSKTDEEVFRILTATSRGPGAELYTVLVRCAQEYPHMSEDEFSRVVLQWRCSRLQCGWIYIDPDAWSRISPTTCRDAGSRRCAAEAFDYLATGAISSTR